MKFPRNTTELKCWDCEKPVSIGDGSTHNLPYECYHDACWPVQVARSWVGIRAGAEIDLAAAIAKRDAALATPPQGATHG